MQLVFQSPIWFGVVKSVTAKQILLDFASRSDRLKSTLYFFVPFARKYKIEEANVHTISKSLIRLIFHSFYIPFYSGNLSVKSGLQLFDLQVFFFEFQRYNAMHLNVSSS